MKAKMRKRQKPIHWDAGASIAAQAALVEHPFQGPDKLGRTLKCGVKPYDWIYTAPAGYQPWKHSTKSTTTTKKHVDLSRRVFTSLEGYEFTFWALAPIQPGLRSKWQNNMHCEFVWLILEGTNGRGVHIALVDPETSEVRWWRSSADHWTPSEEAIAS